MKIMKKSGSGKSARAGRAADRVGRTTPQSESTGESVTGRPARAGGAKPPDLLPEHCPASETVTVPVRLYSPQAHEVFLAGSFNGWQPRATPLTRGADGQWTMELSLKPGRYEYRYVVDGQWADDPAARCFAANPFGGLNSVLEVERPASTPAFSETPLSDARSLHP